MKKRLSLMVANLMAASGAFVYKSAIYISIDSYHWKEFFPNREGALLAYQFGDAVKPVFK